MAEGTDRKLNTFLSVFVSILIVVAAALSAAAYNIADHYEEEGVSSELSASVKKPPSSTSADDDIPRRRIRRIANAQNASVVKVESFSVSEIRQEQEAALAQLKSLHESMVAKHGQSDAVTALADRQKKSLSQFIKVQRKVSDALQKRMQENARTFQSSTSDDMLRIQRDQAQKMKLILKQQRVSLAERMAAFQKEIDSL